MSTTTNANAAITSPDRTAPADTAHALSLLPTELLLDILPLCQISSLLPATCRAISTEMLKLDHLPHRIWSHRHIFLNAEHNPQSAWRNDGPLAGPNDPPCDPGSFGPRDINALYPRVAQIQSHLSVYLKGRVPVPAAAAAVSAGGGRYTHPYAAGMAPPEPNPESAATVSVLSDRFIDWLFSKAGPFGSSAAAGHDDLDVVVELRKLRKFELDKDAYMSGEDDEYEDYFDLANGIGSDDNEVAAGRLDRDAAKWRLVPDALLLVHFFIRTTQLGLLEQTLTHLRAAVPTIATASAPISVWSFCMLDNRPELRSNLSSLASPTEDLPNSYPTFLCLLALFDWSKPALDVVLRVFSDSINLPSVLDWIHRESCVLYGMFETLHLMTSPPSRSARVLDILHLFEQHDAPIDQACFEGISPYITSSCRIFVDVLLHFDLPSLPDPLDECGAHLRIARAIVDWVRKGHVELVNVALEHDLLDENALKQVRWYAASSGDSALVAKLAAVHIE